MVKHLLWHHIPHRVVTGSSVMPIIQIVGNPLSCFLAVQGSQAQIQGVRGYAVNGPIWCHFCLFVWLLVSD